MHAFRDGKYCTMPQEPCFLSLQIAMYHTSLDTIVCMMVLPAAAHTGMQTSDDLCAFIGSSSI